MAGIEFDGILKEMTKFWQKSRSKDVSSKFLLNFNLSTKKKQILILSLEQPIPHLFTSPTPPSL
jgi:hypothetical protein